MIVPASLPARRPRYRRPLVSYSQLQPARLREEGRPGEWLPRQDSNLKCLDQNQMCCQLHHGVTEAREHTSGNAGVQSWEQK